MANQLENVQNVKRVAHFAQIIIQCAPIALIIMDLNSLMVKKQANVINVQMDAYIMDVEMMLQFAHIVHMIMD